MTARMIPATLKDDTPSEAERLLFPRLRDQLGNEFTVFHSLSFTGRNQQGNPLDVEIDFLVYSPDFGFLIIEAKDGLIEYDGSTDTWYQNKRALSQSPFSQARFAKYQLRDLLLEKLSSLKWLSFGHAVCFPDAFKEPPVWPLETERAICLLGSDMTDLGKAVVRIMTKFKKDNFRPLTPEQSAKIKAILQPWCEFGLSLADRVGQEERKLFELTEEQCRLLDFIHNQNQALIQGCAGSGKTVMAVKKAQELAAQGNTVLLLVFNLMLAETIKKSVAKDSGITVEAFHPYCEAQALAHGMTLPDNGDQEYFESFLPDALMQVLDDNPIHYDAVIVDEGQDFKPHYWAVVSQLVKEGGYFYIFFDPEQDVFNGGDEFPIIGKPFLLNHNCRNTQKICQNLERYTDYDIKSAKVPEGHEITEYYSKEPTQRLRWLSKILHHLINDQGLRNDQVVVLGGHDPEKTCLPSNGRVGAFAVGRGATELCNGVEYQTYLKFKGCEADAVILLDVDYDDTRWSRRGLYTSISRAKHLLYIIGLEPPSQREN